VLDCCRRVLSIRWFRDYASGVRPAYDLVKEVPNGRYVHREKRETSSRIVTSGGGDPVEGESEYTYKTNRDSISALRASQQRSALGRSYIWRHKRFTRSLRNNSSEDPSRVGCLPETAQLRWCTFVAATYTHERWSA